MSTAPGASPWRGRILALVGILLVALNLRAAVVALAPIADRVSADVPLDAIVIGVLGAAPPLAFALAGLLTPRLARRVGIEHALVVGIGLMAVGQLVRAVAPVPALLVTASVVAFLGIGIGNVLMPPLVRRYFPDRIGGVSGGYITVQALGATVAPLVAVPVAAAAGWRVSLGSWALVALVAAVPWIVELILRRGREPRDPALLGAVPPEEAVGRMWRSPTAWAMAAGFASTAAIAYSVFSTFPALLAGVAGVDDAEAGALVAVFSLGGLPLAIVMPMLAARLRSAVGPILFTIALSVVGFLGLLLAPHLSPWLWMGAVSLGGAFFPYCLALVGMRSRTQAGAVALSGFMQGVGYIAGAVGPLLVGILHAITGGWTASLILLLVALVPLVPAAFVLSRPRFVEDEVARLSP